jgi:Pyruvate/2-oxoacid:ferredoxin oxidoreductase delta subunit
MITKRIVLHFPKTLAGQPVVYKLAKDYDLEFNILKAYITPENGGRLVLEVSGEDKNYELGIRFITEAGIAVKPLSQDIVRNEETCCHCGACVPLCPTATFLVEPSTRRIEFRNDRCIACGLCVKICPFHAISIGTL